ncbi:hypothetical protein HPULCUR_003447 [Helicostylum pulchrum]|uniref:IRG-type G domain-containing protein n=1 Tax=Helicostylum pulchrum TaxID=562976 RepID=A0ABP9XUK1_9FUNG
MGAQHSIIASAKVSTETANDLWRKESTKKGIKAAGALGAAILFAPAVILALPFVGAYEFGTALENELVTGYPVMDGVIGGLFGVVVSPIAPFYCFLVSIQEIFELKYNHERHPHLIDKNYLKRAEGMLRLDFSHYNVAITGCPGTGKSSILNGLLGYKESNAKAATVGEIETTLEPKFYRHPILNTLYLWDMPGVGTPRHPIENFFENYCLGAFDAILIVFDDRLMASDIDIARRAIKYDIPSIATKIERMKSDTKLNKAEQWTSAVSQLTVEIKDTIYKNMQQFGLDTNHLYIVSANVLRDFVILVRDRKPVHEQQKLIHEKVLITNLLDTLVERKDKGSSKTKSDSNVSGVKKSLRKRSKSKELVLP